MIAVCLFLISDVRRYGKSAKVIKVARKAASRRMTLTGKCFLQGFITLNTFSLVRCLPPFSAIRGFTGTKNFFPDIIARSWNFNVFLM